MSATAKDLSDLSVQQEVLLPGNPTFEKITEAVSRIIEGKTTRWWYSLFGISVALTVMLVANLAYLFWEGTGIWGLNNPVGWGWAIVNFVFWVGIGHAGTLISAILFLLRQRWRTSINRFAEAMTIFAVICALMFPGIHVGRVWVLHWVFPLPNQMGAWPNFRSPLLWDTFAVSTYFTCSLLFWYVGLMPDLATMRDRAKTRIRKILFGLFSLGWRGGNRQWKHYELAYLVLAGISTPLVLSVHSIVATDFATSIVPGWHTTIFPPYFVAGAIFSGFAMVLTLSLIARKVFNIEDIITPKTLERMTKIILLTGSMVGYAYSMEFFIAWYSGNMYEKFAFVNRAFGPYAWAYWIMISCNVIVPQLFWFKRLRYSIVVMFIASILINVGMWFERFVIVVTLSRDYLPSSWDYYSPTKYDVMLLIGSFGLFFMMFLLFLRFLPMVAMSEIKGVLPQADPHHHVSPDAMTEGEAGMKALSKRFPDTVLAEFDSAAALIRAAEKIRDAGYTKFDCHSPFPVHGMDRAMGLKRSPLGYIVGVMGTIGLLGTLTLTWWTSAVDYPLVISGKPYFTWQAFIPVIFALTVLFSAFGAFFGMLALNRLPRLFHPLFFSDRFKRVTDGGFFVSIESDDPEYSETRVRELLEKLGGTNIEVLRAP